MPERSLSRKKNVPIKEILKKESEHQTCQKCLTKMELMVQLSYITKTPRKETIWLKSQNKGIDKHWVFSLYETQAFLIIWDKAAPLSFFWR